MIKIVPLSQCTAYCNTFCQQLWISSFPHNERRDGDKQQTMAAMVTTFHPCTLIEDEQPVGLLYWWSFPRFRYIEHFAVAPALRGRRIGERALQHFLEQSPLPVLLEVECPDEREPLTLRRIAFYERNGFHLLHRPYLQPPYHVGDGMLPMRLMITAEMPHELDIDTMCSVLYKEVYLV